MVTRYLFAAILCLFALQRLAELRHSRINEKIILGKGGWEHAPGHYRWMKILHTAWFVVMLVEVFGFQRPFIPGLSITALLLLSAGQFLRYAAIRTLGWRWTVRVMAVPGEEPIRRGIYRSIRHPNYLGVMLEILAVPLLHSAYLTAFLFTLANGLLLGIRIREEEDVLSRTSNYREVFDGLPRFLPKSWMKGRLER